MKKWMVILLCFLFFFSVGCTSQEENVSLAEDGAFLFVDDDMVFPLGDIFLKDVYLDALKVDTEEGRENTQKITYTYQHYEVVTFLEEDIERIYYVTLLDDQVSTMEGIKVSDSVDKMIQVYGENYRRRSEGYEYFRGDTSLVFYVRDSSISKIEYRYQAKTDFDDIEDTESSNFHSEF